MRVTLLLGLCLLSCPPLQADADLRIATQNLDRLFDDVDNGRREKVVPTERFLERISIAADRIGGRLGLPHILALQEVENREVLERLARAIEQRHGVRYRARLLEGHDLSGINLGFMVRDEVDIRRVEQLFRERILPRDGNPLFSRPPLLLEACAGGNCFVLVNLHLRSMRGLDDPDRRERVLDKRLRQAETLANWIDRQQQEHPAQALMLLGDFNALTPSDEWLDLAGILRGAGENEDTLARERDLIEPDLVDLTRAIPTERRYSYIFRRQRQQLDYIFVNRAFSAEIRQVAFTRIEYRLSDHAALYVDLHW